MALYPLSLWPDQYLPTVTASSFPLPLHLGIRSDHRSVASTRIYINTVCKPPILPVPEAEITHLLSSLGHSMCMCKLHISRNFKANSKFSNQNHLRDAKLQLSKAITEAAVLFQTHYHLQHRIISKKGTVQRADKSFTGFQRNRKHLKLEHKETGHTFWKKHIKICETAAWYNAVNKEFLINFNNKLETAARFTSRSMSLSGKVIWSLPKDQVTCFIPSTQVIPLELTHFLHTSLNALQDQGKSTQHLAVSNPKLVTCVLTCDGQVTILRKTTRNEQLLCNSKAIVWGYFHLFTYKHDFGEVCK